MGSVCRSWELEERSWGGGGVEEVGVGWGFWGVWFERKREGCQV